MSREWEIDQKIKRLIAITMTGKGTERDTQDLQHAISDRTRRMRRLPPANYRGH